MLLPTYRYEPSTDGRPVISEYIEASDEQPCWHCGTPTSRVELDFEARLCRTQCLLAKTDAYWRSLANHPASQTGTYDPEVGF
jgi:hypothetical protein